MNKNIYIISLIFLITLFTVSAYNSSNIISYYDFEDNTTINYNDVHDGNNLTGINFPTVSGKKGYSTYLLSHFNTTNNMLDINKSFTISLWYNPINSMYAGTFLSLRSVNPNDQKINIDALTFCGVRVALINILTGATYSIPVSLPCSEWSMISLIYDDTTNKFYIDTNNVYRTTFNNTMTWINSSGNIRIFKSYTTNDKIDELSLWNNDLLIADINQLYNNGNGLNYSQVLSGTDNNRSITVKCLDKNTFCTDSYLYNNNWSCQTGNITFCNNGCNNDICSNNITNGCNILGETKCISIKSYELCDFTAYGNLDYTTITTCDSDKYCVDGFHLAFCTNTTTQTGTHYIYGIKIFPNAISDENTTYTIDEQTSTISITSVFSQHKADFTVQGVNYASRICNYTESLKTGELTINETDSVYTLTSPIATNSLIRINLLPINLQRGNITIRTQSGSAISSIYYIRNSTAKNICMYYYTGDLIYCDNYFEDSDSLNNVALEYAFNFVTNTYTIRFDFNRSVSNSVATYPILFSASNIYSILMQDTNTVFSNENIYLIPDYLSFKSFNTNTLYIEPCYYSSIGSNVVRVYGNNNGMPDYSIYKDYNVYINKLGATKQEISGQKQNGISTADLHMILAYIIVFAVSIIVSLLIFGVTHGSEKSGGFVFLGFLTALAIGLCIFSFIKWINPVFAGALILFDAVIIGIVVKFVIFSTQ